MNLDLYNKLKNTNAFNNKGIIKYAYLNRILTEKYPDIYKELIESSPFTDDLFEKVYLLNHERGTCVICNNPTKYISGTKGYQKTCSEECKNKLISKNTSERQLGKKRPKEVFEKMKETRKKNNSVAKISETLKKTNLERFGETSYFKTPEFKRKALTTLQEKWDTSMDIDYLCTLEYDMAKYLIYIFSKTKGRIDSTIELLFDYHDYTGVYHSKEEIEKGSICHKYYPFKCLTCDTKFEDFIANGHKPECPTCNPPVDSRGEKFIKDILTENKVEFEDQKSFEGLKSRKGKPLKFDFYLLQFNLCIEYQGVQHYSPQEHFGGVENFKEQLDRGERKRKYCNDNNIELWEIKYDIPFQEVEKQILEKLNI